MGCNTSKNNTDEYPQRKQRICKEEKAKVCAPSTLPPQPKSLEHRVKKPQLSGTLDGDKELIVGGKNMDTCCAHHEDL